MSASSEHAELTRSGFAVEVVGFVGVTGGGRLRRTTYRLGTGFVHAHPETGRPVWNDGVVPNLSVFARTP